MQQREVDSAAVRHRICTLALMVTSALVTGIKLVFKEDVKAAKNAKKRIEAKPVRKRRKSVTSLPVQVAAKLDYSKVRSYSVDGMSADGGSVCSSVDGSTARSQGWKMEEVCGQLRKQSDIFGLWKQRYFRLASFDSHELGAFTGIAEEVRATPGNREFVLLYWACSAREAISGNFRYSPRGAYLVKGCKVTLSDQSKMVFEISNVVNAMNPSSPVQPIKLSTGNFRMAQNWISALSFASIAPKLMSPQTLQPYPVPDMYGTLGLCASRSGDGAFNFYFKVFAGEFDTENHQVASRSFLLVWDSENQAMSRPITAQSMYDLSSASVTVSLEAPCILVIHGVQDFMQLNRHVCHGKLYLKAKTPEEAVAWANVMIPDETKRDIRIPVREEPLSAQSDFSQASRESVQSKATDNASRRSSIGSTGSYTRSLLNIIQAFGTSFGARNPVLAGTEALVDEMVIDSGMLKGRRGEQVVDEISAREIYASRSSEGERSRRFVEYADDEKLPYERRRYTFYGSDDDDDEDALLAAQEAALSGEYSPTTRELLEPISRESLSPNNFDEQIDYGYFDGDYDNENSGNVSNASASLMSFGGKGLLAGAKLPKLEVESTWQTSNPPKLSPVKEEEGGDEESRRLSFDSGEHALFGSLPWKRRGSLDLEMRGV